MVCTKRNDLCSYLFASSCLCYTYYLLTCCTESERSAEYGKTCLVFSNYINLALNNLMITSALTYTYIRIKFIFKYSLNEKDKVEYMI